jgi:hypothetical protein
VQQEGEEEEEAEAAGGGGGVAALTRKARPLPFFRLAPPRLRNQEIL